MRMSTTSRFFNTISPEMAVDAFNTVDRSRVLRSAVVETPCRDVVMPRESSLERARAFWYSDDYQSLKPLRAGTGTFRVTLVEGLQKEALE